MTKICKLCEKAFEAKKSHIHRRKYCSISCLANSRRTRPILYCLICKAELAKGRSKFCSLACHGKSNRGKPLHFQKDPINRKLALEKMKKNKTHFTRDNPTCNSRGYPCIFIERKTIFLHRLVVEETIGRKLTSFEVVHHINEDIKDFRIENLFIFPSSGKHAAYHKGVKAGRIKPIVSSNVHKFM